MSEPLTNFDQSLSLRRTSPAPRAEVEPSGENSSIRASDISDRQPYISIPPPKVPDINNNRRASSETMYETQNNLDEEKYELVVLPERKPIIQERFIPLQKWEGTIQQVADDHFVARLVDKTENNPDEVAEFMLEEVSPADRDLVKPGAIFYWNIGYEEKLSGQRIRASIIKIRRLPKWRTHEIETAKHDAERTRDILNWK